MNVEAAAIIERTARFLGTPAVVGHEGPFLDLVERDLRTIGRSTERSEGLLVAHGDGQIVLSAHVDRHGLVTAERGRLIYAAAAAAGEHRPLTPRRAAVVCKRFAEEEAVAYDSTTGRILGHGTIDHADHCGIGEGLQLFARGFPVLDPGTPVGFAGRLQRTGGWLSGQLDNVITVAMIVELLATGFDGTALFTAGEEAGRSWQSIVEWMPPQSDELLVLDTSPFDTADEAEHGVVVLRHRDAGETFSDRRSGQLADAARSTGATVVWKDAVLAERGRPLGRTELGRVVAATSGRVTGTTLQVPTTDYHTNREATTEAAVAATVSTLLAYAEHHPVTAT